MAHIPPPSAKPKGPSIHIDYTKIANSQKFKNLVSAKKSFLIPWTIFYFVFYYTLPFMTAFSKVLNTPAIGAITWAWLFAFAQFIMVWALCSIYSKKAASFDVLADEVVEENGLGGHRL